MNSLKETVERRQYRDFAGSNSAGDWLYWLNTYKIALVGRDNKKLSDDVIASMKRGEALRLRAEQADMNLDPELAKKLEKLARAEGNIRCWINPLNVWRANDASMQANARWALTMGRAPNLRIGQ
jgi:hypothetical protein